MSSRSPHNPARRNRNIGTPASGHGSNNRLVIPTPANGPIWYWRDIGEYRAVKRVVCDREIAFVVEKTNRGCVHACTVDDITHLLGKIPPADWEGLNLFVLRQPKRKEAVLCGVWGRLAYGGEIGRPQDGMFKGPAIFLESCEPNFKFSLSASMRPDAKSEYKRLIGDGHSISRQGRRFLVQCSLESIRNTQLYRTLLHEIGHWVDWLEKVDRPSKPADFPDDDFDWRMQLREAYDRRPSEERESFAHRYADRMAAQLAETGAIPFPRQVDLSDLDPTDFVPQKNI